MSYTRFQMPGDRHIVRICPAGDDALAFAVVREDDHPFDLDPAVPAAEQTRALRDALHRVARRPRPPAPCPPPFMQRTAHHRKEANMTNASSATRKIRTRLDVMTTQPCAMSALDTGERFVGPDGSTVYKVTTSCREHPRRWLQIWNLSMTDAEVKALLAEPGAVEPGTDPRDGFFTYPQDTVMQPTRALGAEAGGSAAAQFIDRAGRRPAAEAAAGAFAAAPGPEHRPVDHGREGYTTITRFGAVSENSQLNRGAKCERSSRLGMSGGRDPIQ